MTGRARRKELLQAYRTALLPIGIFGIRNLASGRVLIGQSSNLPGSWNRHRMELRLGTHRNKALREDWHTYGESQFAFEVLQLVEERPEPDFDYAGELARCLGIWRARVPPGSADSYL